MIYSLEYWCNPDVHHQVAETKNLKVHVFGINGKPFEHGCE